MNANMLIRTATTADIAQLKDFFARLDNPSQAPWIEIMMDGRHPHTRAENFVLAEDQANGKITTCSVYMPWTYLYDGTPIQVSRVEQVFAEPEYQGQGLMKAVFNQIHQYSARRGDVMQVVYGRPGLYRHLGYSLALPNEEEGFLVSFHEVNLAEGQPEFTIRPAEEADFPLIAGLYQQSSSRYAVCLQMGIAELYYGKHVYPVESLDVVKNRSGETVGFIRFLGKEMVYALELIPEVSYYRFRKSFLWHMKSNDIPQIALKLGEHHPFYDVLDEYPQKKLLTLHGYARIDDIPAFLGAVTSVLDKRLQASAYAGFDGSPVLCLNDKDESYRLTFKNGHLERVEPVTQDFGDFYITRDRLIRLFLGRLSLADLDRESAEVYFKHPDFRRIIGILFPKKQSFIYSVN